MPALNLEYEKISRKLNDIRTADSVYALCGNEQAQGAMKQKEFFYLWLRALAGVKRIRMLDKQHRKQFQADFDEYARMFYDMYGKRYSGQGNVFTYAVDLLSFTGTFTAKEIRSCLPLFGHEPYIQDCGFGDCVAFAAIRLADRLFAEGPADAAEAVLKSLLEYSLNHGNSAERHGDLAVFILSRVQPQQEQAFALSEFCLPFFREHKGLASYHNYLWSRHFSALAADKKNIALDALAECILIREKSMSQNDWLVAFPKSRFFILARLAGDDGDPYGRYSAEREYVEDFIRKTLQNGFGNWGERDVRLAVGELLSFLLQFTYLPYDTLPQHKDWIEVFTELCEEFEQEPSAQLIKKRIAKHIEGALRLQENDLIGAEQAFENAMQYDRDTGAQTVITDTTARINLLTTYYRQSEYEKADALMLELFQELPSSAKAVPEWLAVLDYRIALAQIFQEEDEDFLTMLSDQLDLLYQRIRSLEEDEYYPLDERVCVFYIDAVNYYVANLLLDVSEELMEKFRTILNYFRENEEELLRRPSAKTALAMSCACFCWRGHDPRAVDFARSTILKQRDESVSPQLKIGALAGCAHVLMDFGYSEEAGDATQELLECITENWHSSVRYYNNTRLESFLIPAQINFAYVSSLLRKLCDARETYGFVLQYKALASLAGRERNRFLRSRPKDSELIERVNALQDKIAEEELDALIHNEDRGIEADRRELRRLEAELAEQIPTDMDFTEISLERVLDAIPDNCAVLEYQIYASQSDKLVVVDSELRYPTVLDAYLVLKENGKTRLLKHSIENCAELVPLIDLVEDVFRRESLDRDDPAAPTMAEIEARDDALYSLYDILIRPFRDEIDPFETLYIAPDQMMNAIPFEILKSDRKTKKRLSDSFSVIRLDSARDFLFGNDLPRGTDSLILGNPKYDAASDGSSSFNRLSGIRAESVKQLPFSEFEAERVAKICGAPSVVGARAVKSVLTDKADYGLIHLATHGFFDAALENNAVYSSFLLFAGAKTWISDKHIDPVYGNGIVTADEISRLDLRKVKLVVLSACFSGMTDAAVTQNLRGLLGGFAAAGVQYVITQQWSANDVATAALMEYFYEALVHEKMEPSKALAEAKLRLRESTLADLESLGIIRYGIDHASTEKDRLFFERLRRRPSSARPFASEYYWGGFACHRCW